MPNPLPDTVQAGTQAAPEVNASIAISDPGERLRSEHYRLDRFVIGIGNLVAWIFPILMHISSEFLRDKKSKT